ncbi:hypothetical protein HIM_08518 [Hirsutella minnesotensis 3608]|uniref:Zn(2)-C6 fungal-type domain-containing protein n=1 Tax=Hirsutella minnesotensis 3608 TaxID=1043627 RepID=A0A0F7ZSW3_9HYPO|nr:hypothetical protein HIM_08518 [Hirsutella minnesotensis 3608]
MNAPPVAMAEDEANSTFSLEEGGSSGDETTSNNGPAAVAGQKRKRVKYQKTSCELCKARKVKCDRAEPACSWCARHNRACVYLERQKPGSRIGFTLELESKVNRVDALLQTLWRRVEDHIAHDHGQPSGPTPIQTLSPAISSHNTSHVDGVTLPSSTDAFGHARPLSMSASTPILRGSTPAAYSSPSWRGSIEAGRDGLRAGAPAMSVVTGPPSVVPSMSMSNADVLSSSSFQVPDAASRFPTAPRAVPSSFSGGSDLPPPDMIYTLVDLYFKHCNTWCPILDRKSTFSIFFGSTTLSEVDRILLHAIVATTLRFLKDPRLTREMRTHYHAVSRQAVMMYAMEHVSVASLKALVILALDELGTSNGPRGWNILALLTQNVRQLNLFEENSMFLSPTPGGASARTTGVGPPQSWIEDEGRRRLCWMVYLLDRYATVATTTHDFMIDDSKMRRMLPCSYDLFSRNVPVETRSVDPFTASTPGPAGSGVGVGTPAPTYVVNKPENLGSFSYHCEILRVLSRVHDFVRAPIDVTSPTAIAGWRNTYRSLDSSLDNWLQGLPSEYGRISALCHSDPASRVANWFMLHSAYVTSVVRLHSAAAYPMLPASAAHMMATSSPASAASPHSSPPHQSLFAPSHYAVQRCLAAVQSLRDITQDVYEANGLDLVGPSFAFALWVAARLLIVHASAVGASVDNKIDFFIDVLGHVGKNWEVANDYARVLARVVQRGRQQGDGSFCNMRRSAHELVKQTAATRRSGLQETMSQQISQAELDDMDVFDFFNYPKVSDPGTPDSRGPDPESTWLGYSPILQ